MLYKKTDLCLIKRKRLTSLSLLLRKYNELELVNENDGGVNSHNIILFFCALFSFEIEKVIYYNIFGLKENDMKVQTKLNAQMILDKEFPAKKPGYDALEVDKYLDIIVDDYSHFEEYVK